MRRALMIAVLALVVVAGSTVVWAGKGEKAGAVDRQTLAWTTEDVGASSEWQTVKQLTTTTGCQGNGRVAANVSLALTSDSSPVDVRTTMDDPLCPNCDADVLRPGSVTLDGTSSFTFVTGRSNGSHGTRFKVQWRLPEGAQPSASATLDKGSVHVLWKVLKGTCL